MVRRLAFAVLLLLALFIILSLLIQVPLVQNWGISKIAHKVSHDLGTEVSIGQVKLDVFNDLVVDDLLILDEENDTLLYSKRAYFDLEQPLRGIFDSRLTFQQIELAQSKCFLKTNEAGRTNYQFLLDYLSKGRIEAENQIQDTSSNQDEKLILVFSPTKINLGDIHFTHNNKEKGKYSSLVIPNLQAELERIDANDPLRFSSINVEAPRLRLDKYPTGGSPSSLSQAESVGQVGQTEKYQERKPLSLIVDHLVIQKGYARVINKFKPIRKTFSNVIDFRDASAQSINVIVKDLLWEDDQGNFRLQFLDLRTPEGFKINALECEEVSINNQEFALNNYRLETPNSVLTNRLSLTYGDLDDFTKFEDNVFIKSNFRNSQIALRDILYFVNSLNENEFFELNGGERIELNGRISGPINKLRSNNFILDLKDKGKLAGEFSLDNITSPGNEHVTLALNQAEVDITTLRQLIPRFNPPDSYDKLGLLQFSGRFDGAFNDFVASGDLVTDLGNLKSDLRIAIPDSGISEAAYQGNLELINFDLGTWTGSEQYGLASFSATMRDGKNLHLDNASANLAAELSHFYFNGYNYRNILLKGELNKSFFKGKLYSADPNLDLDFDGSIDYRDSIPHFDFIASVDHLDLRSLNLSKKDLSASGDITFDFSLSDIYHIDGSAQGYNLQIEDGNNYYNLDTVTIFSILEDPDNNRVLTVKSDIIDFDLRGKFDLQKLPNTFNSLAQSKHPQFADKFKISFTTDSTNIGIGENDFIFDVVLKDSKGLQRILDASLADYTQVSLNGYVKNTLDKDFSYRIAAEAPVLEYKKYKILDLAVDLDGRNEKSIWDLKASEVWAGEKSITPIGIQGTLVSDSLTFTAQSDDVADVFKKVDIGGLFYLNEGFYQINLANSSFELLDEPWQIIPDNFIQVGDRYLRTKNMVFLSDDSYLRLSSPGDNSLELEAEKIDISFLDDLFKKKQLAFKGNAYSRLRFADIFEPSEVAYSLSLDTLMINGDDFGQLGTTAKMDSLTSRGQLNVVIDNPNKIFEIDGHFFLTNEAQADTNQPQYQFDLQVADYPIAIAEYFIGHSISETTGSFDAQITLHDEDNKPALNGHVVLDGALKIDYLGTTYHMNQQTVKVSPMLFDFTGAEFLDELGNKADFTGGITHNYLKDLGLDVSIVSDYFMFLNTTKNDNDLYYGQGIGQGLVEIGGTFQAGNIRVKATTGPGSNIAIPINYDYSTGEHFIKYVFNEDSLNYKDASAELRGTNFDMQLNITPDADMQIIFDEFSGDIIKGTGNGNLTMTLERGGTLQMNGKYVIEQGQYLYTLLDFINKPFSIERGGLITWTGDPLAADLNIKATYTGLKVPPRNLIAEYLEGRNNSAEGDLADISTQVDLVLGLEGILSQPEIDFDIQFPDIDPAIRNLTDSKMRVLKEDVSELNRQVYGLLFFNSFLPPSINLDLTATTVNTLSEFLTSQLSNYVAAYITEGVEEVDYISGVDFYFDYNFYRSEDLIQGTQTGVKTGSEFALAPNIRFFNDRLAFSPGASVIDGTVLQGSTFIGTDVKLDFFLTEDKRLKLSLFYKRFPSLNGGRNKLGLGFRFFKQYDSLGDIFRRNKTKTPSPPPEENLETSLEKKGN